MNEKKQSTGAAENPFVKNAEMAKKAYDLGKKIDSLVWNIRFKESAIMRAEETAANMMNNIDANRGLKLMHAVGKMREELRKTRADLEQARSDKLEYAEYFRALQPGSGAPVTIEARR